MLMPFDPATYHFTLRKILYTVAQECTERFIFRNMCNIIVKIQNNTKFKQ